MSIIQALATTAQSGKFNGATLDAYIQWGTGNQKTVNYFYNGTAKQNELNNQYSGMTLKTPDSLGAYTLDNEGWYLLQDIDYNSATGVYTAKSGRENYDFSSSNDIWDLFSYYISTYYNGGTTGFKAGEDRSTTKIYNTAAGTLTLYAAKKSVVASPQFGVIYEKGSSDSGSTTTEQLINISDASKTNTKTASEVSFTKVGYTFKGWASSASNAAAETLYIAGGVPFSNISGDLGTGNKTGANAIHLYPIWHQDTYTVVYHAGKGSGADVTKTYHSTGNSTTDKAESQGSFQPYTKTGYTVTFAGWSRSNNGTTVNIAANASLATVNPANNGSAPADSGRYDLYAVWTETADTFKVTYKVGNSGSGSESTVTYNVVDASTTNFPSGTTQGLAKTGYDFAGWSTSSSATTPDTGFTISGTLSALSPAKDGTYTVFPVWTPKKYTVNWAWRYNASGTPTSGYTTTTDATYGSSDLLANNIPSAAPSVGATAIESNVQYTFKGWYLTRDNGKEWKSATSTTALNTTTHNLVNVLAAADTKTDNSVTIWGIWDSANQVTITYIENKPGQTSEVTYSTVDRTYAGTTFNIKNIHPEETGYTFRYWSTDKNDASSGTRYANPALTNPTAANTITPSGNVKLYAIWKVHSVKFALAPGTTDTVDLKQKTSLASTTKTVGQSISWNDLVTATPTRNGYDFAGFKGEYSTSANTTSTFDINSSSPTSWTVLATAAATDGATIILTAQWTPTVYYVRYNANAVAGDTGNTVKFWKGSTQISQIPYAASKQNGNGADLIYTTTGLDTFGGLSDPTYGDSEGNWYTFGGWGSTSSATNPINSGDSFMTLYNAQTHITNKYLDLYAIWTPITINIKYTTEDSSKGTVAPAAKTNISLAVATSGYGSTATPATPSGLSVSPYQLATPTWTYEGTVNTSGISFGIPASTQQASYMPDLTVLRKLYLAGERNAEFQAHFVPRDFGYEIRVYTQQADGSYNTAATTNDGFVSYLHTNAPDGNTLTASYGSGNTKVNATTTVVPGTSTTLADWALTKNYSSTSISMSDLFEFVAGMGGKNEITISTVESNNVIELYYKRKTYDLTASYEGKPSTVTDSATDHLSKTTGIRWGETVALTTPNAANYNGYTFAWGADVPAGATVTSNSFKLDETAFANLSGTANVKGAFTPKTYTVEIRNNIPTSQNDNNGYLGWTGGGTAKTTLVGSSTATASTTATNGQNLAAWAPLFVDTTNLNFYFVGWSDGSETITDAQLAAITSWTEDKVYNGVWAQKVAIIYQPGTPDSKGNSKATWATKTVRVTDSSATLLANTGTATLAGGSSTYTNALFNTIYASDSGAIVGGLPGAAAGWTFDYWEIANYPEYSNRKYGHTQAYDADGYYLASDSNTYGIAIGNGGLTLVAHWKANPVAVTVNASGAVANNNSEYASIERVTIGGNATNGRAYGAQTGNNTYNTDDEIDLAGFAPVTTPNGYELVGWTVTDGGIAKTYATNAKIRLGTDAVELWPVFDEDTVTFTYKLDTASSGRSAFAAETDTIYVVKHNGVTAHTVTPSDTHAYKFEGWKLDAEATSGFEVTDATIDSNAAVFNSSFDYTQDHTFYAHIAKQSYTVTFAKPGKFDDGTNAPAGNGATVKTGTDGAGYGNDITVEWGDSIPNDCLDLEVPLGYKLAGWFEGNDSTTNVTYGTGDLAGIYQRAITDDVTLYPHYTIDTNAQFKVIYDYGQAASVGTHQSSKMVIWTANVLPDAMSDQKPTVSGYSFDNWYIDPGFTQTVADTGNFSAIWNHVKAHRDEENKTITIHLNMNPKTYTVNYDINGGDSDPIPSKSGVKWVDVFGDPTNGFKPTDPTRNGYTFGGWTVSWSDGTETWDNGGNIVATNDTYGKLSKNGTDAGTVTLVAKWNAAQLPVTYVFADGSTPNYTGNFEWDRDYNYLLAYANPAPTAKPTRAGFLFDSWTVTYNTSDGTQTGASINDANPTSSIKTMVGDKSGWSNLTLTANWKQVVNWQFLDVLVDRDGTEHERDASLSQQGVVGQTIKHADSYTPHADNYYEGYDFDQYVAVLGATHPSKTADEVSLPAVADGTTYQYKVYYIERAYDIVFHKTEDDTSAYGTTNANPWTSADATLPGTDPTQTGKQFDGWYVKRTDGSEHKLDTTLAAALSSAPNAGTVIEAYGKWSDLTATISWSADSNGSVANDATAGSSATRTATDTGNGVGTITATPNTNYDFEKWVYSTDGGTTWNDVTTASGVATLSGADANGRYTEITPIPFKASGDAQAIWHDITFKAQFVGSGSMNITIEHYKENANWKTGDPEADHWTKTETTGTSGDGETFTATPQNFDGYTLDTTISSPVYGQTKQSGITLAGDGATETESRIFRLYYTADAHDITYRYVLASDNTRDQTPPSGAPLLPANGSAKTDQTYDVADAPTFAGWDFSGWYESTNYGGTVFDGSTETMGTTDVVYVGTWKRQEKGVTFTAGSQGQVTMSPTSGYVVAVGDKVKTAIPTGNPETLKGLGVDWSDGGAAITLAGWDVYENGVKVNEDPIGISDPLDYVITDITEFRASWSRTFDVQYTRGAHGTFTDKNTVTNPKVEYDAMQNNTPWTSVLYELKGTVDENGSGATNPNYGNPNAADGWTWVGWGSHDSNGVWTYYFAYDSDVDYGTATVTNYGAGNTMPTVVTQNWEFIAFFKPQTRTLIFSNEKPLSPHGPFAPEADKTLSDSAYTMDVKTGEMPTLLDADSLDRAGYTLVGWRTEAGEATYLPGSNDTFVMPELPLSGSVTLYPIFSLDQITINYGVDPDSKTGTAWWGGVSNNADTIRNEGDTISGSTATANNGYVFKYWYKLNEADPTDKTEITGATFDATTGKLTPTESGTYLALFEQKTYVFKYVDAYGTEDVTTYPATMPTDPADAVWTDNVTIEMPNRPGFDFLGWDVYDASDWDATNKAYDGTASGAAGVGKLRNVRAAGTYLVSQITDVAGDQTNLVLVAVWGKETLHVIYDANGGDWSNDKDDYPTTEGVVPTSTNVATDAALQYNTEVGDPIDVRTDATISLAGKRLVGWKYVELASGVEDVSTVQYFYLTQAEYDASTEAVKHLVSDGFKMPTQSVKLVAIWANKDGYEVTFDVNGGDADSAPANRGGNSDPVEWTTVIGLKNSGNVPTYAGKTFLGWTIKNSDGTVLGNTGAPANYVNANDMAFNLLAQNDDSSANAHLTLVANWGDKAYTVTFDVNGGEASTKPTDYTAIDNLQWDDSVTLQQAGADPTYAGRTFTGWKVFDKNNNAIQSEGADLVIVAGTATKLFSELALTDTDDTAALTLVAQWEEIDDYAVTFIDRAVDDTATDTVSNVPTNIANTDGLKWDDSVNTWKDGTDKPARAGYTFMGWDVFKVDPRTDGATAIGAVAATDATKAYSAMADADTTKALWLVAKWEPTSYTINFADGKTSGTGTVVATPNLDPKTNLKYTDTGIALPTVTRDGYTFKGWSNNVNASKGLSESATSVAYADLVDSDADTTVTLTAIWEAKPHTVTYAKGADDTWSTDASDFPTAEPDTATGNGAATPDAPIDVAVDDTLTLRGVDSLKRDGSKLVGWKADDGTEYKFADGATTLVITDADVTLTPIWEESGDYNVKFLPGDSVGATKVDMDTMPADQTGITYAKTGISTAAPTRPGYTFKGWKSSVAGADVAATTTSEDYKTLAGNDATITTVTLTAEWDADDDYQVTYADGVTSGKPFTGTLPTPNPRTGVTYDATDIVNPDLTGLRDGYDFAGWKVTRDDTNAALTTITDYSADSVYSALAGDASIKAITLTAVWTPKSYGVTYHLADGAWQTANINDIPTGGNADSKVPVNVDATYTVRAADTVARAGYKLLGWQTEENGGTKYEFDGTSAFTMPAADVDLFPIWKANDYAVTFEANEPVGTATSVPANVDPIAYDATVTYGAPELSGFDFQGWNVYKTADWTASSDTATPLFTKLAAGSDTYENLAGDPDVTGLTFVAQWDAKSFYVQYHSGSTATEPATWHADKIAADAMGSMNNPDNPVYYKTGVVVKMRGRDTLTTNGKRLLGWKDGTDEGATEYLFETLVPFTFVMPANNVNLYPIWDLVKDYTVAFEDGIAALDPTKIATGATAQNMPTTPQTGLSWTSDVNTQAPSLAGWKFKGWTVYDNATPKAVIGGTDTAPKTGVTHTFNNLALADLDVRHDLTLVANWEVDARYVVTFLDGVLAGETTPVTNMPYETETVPCTKSGLAFTEDVAHTAATRAGYTFDGWSVKAYGVTGDGIALADVTAGTTAYYLLTGDAPGNPAYVRLELTALWTAKDIYKVTFKSQPDTDTGATAVVGLPGNLTGLTWESDVYAGSDTDPVAPTRAGYTFDHWAIQDITAGTDPENIRNIGRADGLGTYKYGELAANDTVEHVLMTAVWVPNTWKVTYEDESGAGVWIAANIPAADKAHPGENAGVYAVDESVIVRGTDVMTRTGFNLIGWATTSANAAAGNADAVDFIMPDNDVTLFAVWEPKTYTVHFLENKPEAATDPLQVVNGMPYATEATPYTKTDLGWFDTVDTQHPTLAGYKFAGWVVKDADVIGAKTGTLNGTTYTYDELALNDATSELTIVALWEAGTYRLIYVDPTDADGAAAETQVKNLDGVYWNGTVAIDDPWTLSADYAVKDAADWQFDGWTIGLTDGSVVTLAADDDLSYAALAVRTGLTVADVATTTDVPALTLTASWTRRVPFVVDFVKIAADGTRTVMTDDAQTLKGLDGDDLATVWASTVLDLGDAKSYKGYVFNRTTSTPNVVGTLATAQLPDELIHVELLYDALTDYVVTYDANGILISTTGAVSAATGAYLKADHAVSTKTAPSPAWESLASGFVPVDAEWAKSGYRLDHWYYVAADGSRNDFDAAMTFEEIAEAIYGTVDGTEGLSTLVDARPVTLFAAWLEKSEYKIVYDDNYTTDYTTQTSGDGYINDKFIPTSTETPSDKSDVAWSTSDIEPTDPDVIVEPGKDLVHNTEGKLASLYELDGWNYSTDGGTTQFAAEGMTFAEIAEEIYGDDEPEDATIRLYARWREIDIELKYQPRNVKSDENGNLVLESGSVVLLDGEGNGTVSINSETVSAVTGNRNAANPKLIADGATVISITPGYHFVGWMRESDGKIIYADGMDPSTLTGMSAASVARMFAMAEGDGLNVLPGTVDNAMTAFQAEQNAADGYWHDETYFALFAANATAVLKYDKNAEDATGEIPDVEAPWGSELTLSDGSAFKRTNWTLTGWNTEADGSGESYALSETGWVLPEEGDILYAMWKKNLATLTYDPGADDVTGVPADQTDEWGTVVKTAEDSPSRPHYTFRGWNTAKDGTGEWIAAGTDLELLPEGITLYAQWDLNTYDVTSSEPVEGGTVKQSGPINVEHGGYLPKGYIEAEPEDGWHLTGWSYVMVDEDGRTWTGTVSDPSELAITGKVTFTPIFEKDATENDNIEESSDDKPQKTRPNKSSSGRSSSKGKAAPATSAAGTLPKTGDTLDLTVLLTLTVTALAILLLAAWKRRKEGEEA